ncbi:DUF1523 family protein [Pseudaeromonas sharmana]|uniref:DUF1523 family protein n=1 Tax=Pseudaeromonas sharmana TaxID=328412 RepID=A0ABV8CJ54_9GAMM
MSQTAKKISFGLLGLLAAASAIWLDFYLPEKQVTTITGVEVKRVDKDGPIGKENPADGPTMDVYYIYTAKNDDQVRVFRNEDTRWSWPFYFKFNSADIQAKAKTLEFDKKLARITSYGWRINMFSWFPNVTKIEMVDSADVSTFSFFRWFWFVLWAGLFGYLGWQLYRLFERRALQHGD